MTHFDVLEGEPDLKGIVHPKMEITRPQAIQDVDEFVSSEKFRIISLEWVPSEWESKQLMKTSQ